MDDDEDSDELDGKKNEWFGFFSSTSTKPSTSKEASTLTYDDFYFDEDYAE